MYTEPYIIKNDHCKHFLLTCIPLFLFLPLALKPAAVQCLGSLNCKLHKRSLWWSLSADPSSLQHLYLPAGSAACVYTDAVNGEEKGRIVWGKERGKGEGAEERCSGNWQAGEALHKLTWLRTAVLLPSLLIYSFSILFCPWCISLSPSAFLTHDNHFLFPLSFCQYFSCLYMSFSTTIHFLFLKYIVF